MFWSRPPAWGQVSPLQPLAASNVRHWWTSALPSSSSSVTSRGSSPLRVSRQSVQTPNAVAPARRDPQVVTGEGHGPVGELLVVRVAQPVGHLAERPRRARVGRARPEDLERRDRRAIRGVADRPRSRVRRVIAAVPPDRVQVPAATGRDVREELVAAGLVVEQRGRRRRRSGGPVIANEVDPRLAAGAGIDRPVGRARVDLRVRLARVVHDVDPFVRAVGLVGRRAHLGVAPEEGVARLAVGVEVAAVARVATLDALFVERCVGRVAGGRRLRIRDIARVVAKERLERPSPCRTWRRSRSTSRCRPRRPGRSCARSGGM